MEVFEQLQVLSTLHVVLGESGVILHLIALFYHIIADKSFSINLLLLALIKNVTQLTHY